MNANTDIRPLERQHIGQAARVVTRAMATNPLHLAIFGDSPKAERMQEALFRRVLQLDSCHLFAAWNGDVMTGVMNFYQPGCCQLPPVKTLRLLPGLLGALGTKLPKVLQWKAKWGGHDPAVPHFHFGPIAVLPAMQGRGTGSTLLRHFCDMADARETAAYLETDKESNVALYEKFGFRVTARDVLFGVDNWFMIRECRPK